MTPVGVPARFLHASSRPSLPEPARADRRRLVAVATHPIQYQAPWFRALALHPSLELHVLFAMLPDAAAQGVGFGRAFEWDVPLRVGYSSEALDNAIGSPSLESYWGSSTPRVGRRLHDLRPDAVLLTGWQQRPLVQALMAAHKQKLPVLMRGESNDLKKRSRIVRWLQRMLLSRCAACLPIGLANAQFYRRRGVSDDQLFSCPYFVDNERFARQARELESDRTSLRAGWQIKSDAFCFLFAGKFIPKKRPADLLIAADRLAGRDGRVHVLMTGSGPLVDDLRALAASGVVPVTFTGFLNQTEIARAYVAADSLVLPSDHGETWGLVVNEAMACGRAAIVSNLVGCGDDLVHEGTTGERFPCSDIGSLVDQMGRMAADRSHAAAMGRAARELVSGEYNLERAVDGVVKAMASLFYEQTSGALS